MFVLDKEFITNHARLGTSMATQVLEDRNFFAHTEKTLASFQNASVILPTEAWKELDTITQRVMRSDEGEAYMADLRALARPVDIGVLVHLKRTASDMGQVTRSLSGQKAVPMDKVSYTYLGTPVPIFDSGYGREWREWNTLQNATFDALADDQEASTAAVMRDQAEYALKGDTTISVQGYQAYGILNHPNSKAINLGTGAGGASINLVTADADDVDAFIVNVLGKVLDDNKLAARRVNFYVSPEIGRAWDRSYSGAAGFKDGTIHDYLLKNRRIAKIEVTDRLSGNQFFGFVPDAQFIRPLIGMAVSTTAITRTRPRDNYQFMVSGAMGLQISADANGHSGVFHSVVVN